LPALLQTCQPDPASLYDAFLSCHLLVSTQFYPFEFTQLATSEEGLLYESDGNKKACGSRL
jgi:hypothetical protein